MKKMKAKTTIKVSIDFAMTVLFLILTGYHITGNRLHEWLGIVLCLLFFLHISLNFRWLRALPKGTYTAIRTVRTILNCMLFVAMLGMIVSGIAISRDVIGLMNGSGVWYGRKLHMAATAWGFILMSVHLGLYWGMLAGMAKGLIPEKRTDSRTFDCRIVVIVLSAYGVCAFVSRHLWLKITLLVEYVFSAYEEPAIVFFGDYISIMVLFACASHYGAKFLKHKETRSLRHAAKEHPKHALF